MTPKSLLAPARLAGRPVLRSQSDERLVDLVRAGSEPAFEAIVTRHRGPLLRYCRRILPEARAEDAVQQAFVSAFAALRRDDAYIDLRPWLYRIAHNTALNALRDRALRDSELDERIDGVERPDQAMERRQGLRDVIAALNALPQRQRDAMILRELEGRSYDEIAGALGVSGGAVRQLLNRARTTLRAGVTAVTPMPLLLRLSSGEGEDTAARVTELVSAGGAGALATKVAATALVTGAVAGGIAAVPDDGDHRRSTGPPAATAASETDSSGDTAGEEAKGAAGRTATPEAAESRTEESGDDRRGRDGGDDGDDGDRSGPGDGTADDGGNSGPGGGGDSGDDGGNSGPGSDSSGPGSDTETESESDNEGPGGGGSGSGESGSGDDSSGSGSGSSESGSASSGSGSSGSGGSSATSWWQSRRIWSSGRHWGKRPMTSCQDAGWPSPSRRQISS